MNLGPPMDQPSARPSPIRWERVPPRLRGRVRVPTRGSWAVSSSNLTGGLSMIAGRTRAFTLLEVMLAMVVAAFVLVAINAVFFGAMRLRTRTQEAMENSIAMERALGILQRDLENVAPPRGALSGSLQTTSMGTSMESTNSLETPEGFGSGQVGPTLHTATGGLNDNEPWSELQRVVYRLAAPTNRTAMGSDLVRSVTRNLLSPVAQDSRDERLLGGVENLRFFYYDGTDWQQTWDSTSDETPLPKAIKVELQLAARDRHQERPPPIELVVPLLIDASTNATTGTSGSAAEGGGG